MAATAYATVLENYPAPALRPWGLFLDNVTEAPDLGDSPPRWMLGVQFQPTDLTELELETLPAVPCDVPATLGDARVYPDVETQGGFNIVDQVACTTLSRTDGELMANIAERWPLLISEVFAREAMLGTAGGPHSFQADATDAGNTATLVTAIAELEERLALGLNNAQGMIHLAPSALVWAITNGTVNLRNSTLYSPGGHIVVADAGYQVAETTTSEVYATGPVYFKMTDRTGRARTVSEIFNWEETGDWTNIQTVIDEAYGIVLFDPNTVWKTTATKA